MAKRDQANQVCRYEACGKPIRSGQAAVATGAGVMHAECCEANARKLERMTEAAIAAGTHRRIQWIG